MNNKRKTRYYMKLERQWVLIDAKDKVCGRLATRIAMILTGKNKPQYTPNAFCGDRVVVINARHLKFTGKKLQDKMYTRYSGYAGGLKAIPLKDLSAKNPIKALQHAVKGMLPKGPRGREILRALKIYPEGEHKQTAQQPQTVTV